MSLFRPGAAAVAALLFGAAGANDTSNDAVANIRAPSRVNWRYIRFRGAEHRVPPSVLPLSGDLLLFGIVEVQVPEGVDFEFNDDGEAVFALAEGQSPRNWVLRVGKKQLVANARSRVVVPLPSVGSPRFESTPFQVEFLARREFLDQAYDLEDPLDASPFR
jgi:hypothetical protein